MRALLDCFGTIVIFIALMAFGFWVWPGPKLYDNTDNPPNRSGMSLYTDALTGCQYLSVAITGITPRLDVNGKQVGCH